MDSQTFILQLVLILFSARLLGEVAAYFTIPSVIGELLAGIVIGPSMLGLVELSNPIHLLGQLGIILLLFEVGLETNIIRLSSNSSQSMIVALGGVILPLLGGYFLCSVIFQLSNMVSLFVGCTLTATSIGITLRVLKDLKAHESKESEIVIGAAILDDIIGIVILAMLYEFATSGAVNLYNIAKVIAFIALFFVLAPISAKIASISIKKWDEKSEIPGLLPTIIVSMILLFAWMAHSLGAPELLGGFASGLALSRYFFIPFASFLGKSEEFSHTVHEQMKPIVHLFTPIFFVAVGLSLNLQLITWDSATIWLLSLGILVVSIIGKLLSGFLLHKESRLSQIIIGTAMIPRGEVGLIFANVGLETGILSNEVFTALILVIATTTFFAPLALRIIYKKSQAA
jgi:Kef-type K+ transport system membrane component KefB